MENKNNQQEGFHIGSQTPIDDRLFFSTEADLLAEINSTHGIYRFFEGMPVWVSETGKVYRWLESASGLLGSSKVYPSGVVVGGVTYSGKSFNLVEELPTGVGALESELDDHILDENNPHNTPIIVAITYNHTTKTSLSGPASYYMSDGSGEMETTLVPSIQIPIKGGTLLSSYIILSNTGVLSSAEVCTLNLKANNGATTIELYDDVTFDEVSDYQITEDINEEVPAGMSCIELVVPSFSVNPTEVKVSVTLYIQI